MEPWIKKFLPRTLYARAAAILLLPTITVFVAITVVFIQRHFEDVTAQLTKSVIGEVQILQQALEVSSIDEVNAQFGPSFKIKLAPFEGELSGNDRVFYDLTARTLVPLLYAELPGLTDVNLRDLGVVHMVTKSSVGEIVITVPRSRLSARNPHQLLVWMFVTGAIITLISFFFLRNQLRPIKRMARAAEAFGKGEIVAFEPSGAIEVRAAGQAFLDMRARIDRQIEQRTLLLSGVSHDLRTPLTRLQLGLEMIDGADKEDLQADVDDMRRMLDGFLDFSRDAISEQNEEVQVESVVRHLVDRFSKEPKVEYTVYGEPLKASLKLMAFRRGVTNLVENALRYGGSARVSLTFLDKSFRITVEDAGPGIPEADRERALRPFVRLDPARNQNQGPGVGLGLAIVADMARAHGGSFRLGESDALGGLKAEIVIPVRQ